MPDLPNLANLDYVARVNRAIDHVTRNLTAPLRLDDVARAACFSPYHFHRVFRSLMGETLAAFVKRIRLERAVYLLSHRDGATLTEIALACGFSSSSDFSRNFRAHYGVPPSAFDLEHFRRTRREDLEQAMTPPGERNRLDGLPAGENPDGFAVTLRELPARHVAYIRVARPYEGTGVVQACERLMAWAAERGLGDGQWLGYQWEDPEIVPLDKCRYDVGVEVPEGTGTGGEVGLARFDAMKIAELPLEGDIALVQRGLDWLFRTWLPRSGYAPDHQPAFEAWHGLPFADGMEHFRTRAQLPVVDASTPL